MITFLEGTLKLNIFYYLSYSWLGFRDTWRNKFENLIIQCKCGKLLQHKGNMGKDPQL
jgi:hypothetical protein